jgi:hypothetical protein
MIAMSQRRPRRRANRKGAMLAFVALSMTAMLGLLALALDIGSGNRQRRIAQTAADASAIAGGTQIYRGIFSAVDSAAREAAAMNGFPTGEVTVNYPPATGLFVGDSDYVEVLIARSVPTLFGSLFGMSTLNVKARAVAGTATFSTYCLLGLASSGDAIDMPGELYANNCAVGSNSGIDAKKIFARTISAVGSVSGDRTGIVRTGVPPFADPFASLTVPAETSCDFTNKVVTGTKTLTPGVYCGGIDIRGATAILDSGIYIIRGGGINGNANNSHMSGEGVTLILTNGPGNDQSAYRPMVFSNSCYLGLTSPTSGPYKGIAIFVDPAAPQAPAANTLNRVCGKGPDDPADIDGVIYIPGQTFELANSNGKLTVAGAIVAKYIKTENGGGKIFLISDVTGNSGIKRLSLVE